MASALEEIRRKQRVAEEAARHHQNILDLWNADVHGARAKWSKSELKREVSCSRAAAAAYREAADLIEQEEIR